MKKIILGNKGFTLVELLTVAIIFLIILAAIFAVLAAGNRSWQIGATQAEVQQQARRAMDTIIRELRQASSIDQGTFAGGVSNDMIRFTTQWGTLEFALNAQNQVQRTSGGATTIIANDIADMQFQLFGGNVVYITITAQRTTVLGHLLQVALNSQVVLRN